MLHKLFQNLLGLILILQTVFMFLADRTSINGIQSALLTEAVLLLIIVQFLKKTNWLTKIILIFSCACIILVDQYEWIKYYYSIIIFLPSIIGLFMIVFANLVPSKKPTNKEPN